MSRRALVTGIAGQDGTYLTELLLGKGYEVYGIAGPGRQHFLKRVKGGDGRLGVVEADMTDQESIFHAVEAVAPDEVYNLAAHSSVGQSWNDALAVTEINAVGALRIAEALRRHAPTARLFQASSADMFGNAPDTPQRETTPLCPQSPYAAAKTFAFHIVSSYRASHGLHASNGIMFNHESPLRAMSFVTRKITNGAARIKLGLANELPLGNLDARRDWGFAGDYVEAMWLMLQQEAADDYVVATGHSRSVREFCEVAFGRLDLDYRDYVVVDPGLFRPADVAVLEGDASKARRVLGWEPRVTFEQMVNEMVDADLQMLSMPFPEGSREASGGPHCEVEQ